MTEKKKTSKKKNYIKPKIKTEKIGDASAMPAGPGPTCDGSSVAPRKTGIMGDGCKIKLT